MLNHLNSKEFFSNGILIDLFGVIIALIAFVFSLNPRFSKYSVGNELFQIAGISLGVTALILMWSTFSYNKNQTVDKYICEIIAHQRNKPTSEYLEVQVEKVLNHLTDFLNHYHLSNKLIDIAPDIKIITIKNKDFIIQRIECIIKNYHLFFKFVLRDKKYIPYLHQWLKMDNKMKLYLEKERTVTNKKPIKISSDEQLKKAISICLSCILIPAHATLTWKFLSKNLIPNTDQTSL